MTQAWRDQPGWVLILYVAPVILMGPGKAAVQPDPNSVYSIPILALTASWAWRTWRGGPISRILLIWTSGLGYLPAAEQAKQRDLRGEHSLQPIVLRMAG